MENSQNKKNILITGATSGLGEATALLFKNKNWNVILTGRNPEKLKKFEELGFTTIKLDISNNQDIENLTKYLNEKNIYIDVLFTNAGYGQFGTIEETPMDLVYKQFETNLFGTIKVIRAVLPFLRKQKQGKIIITSSMAGIMSFPGTGYYAASKYAIEGFADALRYEIRKFNIKVVLIEPGPLDTNFFNVVNSNIPISIDDYSHLGKLYKYLKLVPNIPVLKVPKPKKLAKKVFKAANRKRPRNRYTDTFLWHLIKIIVCRTPSKVIDFFIDKIFLK